jgi:hypothetical protein
MTRHRTALLAAWAGTAIAIAIPAAQQAPHTDVASHIVVTAAEHTPVTSVETTSLVARSSGMEIPIVRVAAANPLSLVVLIDVTSSVSEAMAQFIWDGRGSQNDARPSGVKPPDSPSALFLRPLIRGVLRNLRPDDRVRFGRITNVPELGPNFSADRSDLESSVRWAVTPAAEVRFGNAPIWDAVDLAVRALARETGRRRAIVLVTDGLASGNRIGLDATVDRAAHADVAVFVVGESWGTPRSGRGWGLRDATDAAWFMMKGAFTSPFDQLQRLARSTGGVFLADGLHGSPDPEARLVTVMNLLRTSYLVSVSSPLLPGESGTLSIQSTEPGVTIHVRDRYRRPD